MLMRKGFSFKLTPDGAQARKMSRFAGCTRFVYNKGIAWNDLNFLVAATLKSSDGTFLG